ncbi:MAG: helix-turn-helix transcriptional regulator [Limnobacter sp.]|nr:helix-turn-helix transcriptional regulator [Limnobacter sp.]
MIKCNLSRMMGERKIKISELARETGLNRNTLTLLYQENAKRVELDTLDSLCKYFDCSVQDLFEHTP